MTTKFILTICLTFSVATFFGGVFAQGTQQPVDEVIKDLSEKANALMDAGKFDEAFPVCEELIRLDAKFVGGYYCRSLVYHRKKEFQLEVDDLTKAIALRPDIYLFLRNRGLALRLLNLFARSESDFALYLEKEPKDTEILYYQGNNRLNLGKYDEAIRDLSEVIKREPKVSSGFFMRARTYSLMHDPARAAVDFTKAIELDPTDLESITRRADAYRELKKYDLAYADLDRVLAKDPKNINALEYRAVLTRDTGTLAEAKAAFEHVISLAPDFEAPYVELSYIYFKVENFKKVLEMSEVAKKLDPSSPMAFNNAGYARIMLDDVANAEKDIDKSLELDPDLALALNNRALIKIKRKQYDLALKDIERVLELAPTLSFAYMNRANVFLETGQLDRALADINKALELESDLRPAFEIRARIYDGLRKKALAAADRRRSAKLLAEIKKIRL
ncbi:MAG: tetratricopeptide repeat protein [Acidobacteria bacterium]|nr:tetratricopeptide repeat protein [Acidobacteriota bacterium]